MFKSFGKPTRVIGILGLVFLLAFSLSWFACSERQNATGPQNVVDISGKITPSQLASVMAIQDKHTPELLAIGGVVGTATGLDANGNPAIKVYTENKMVTGIPKQLDGVPVDVEVKGKAIAFALKGTYRPVPIGVSVGNDNECAAGTIGCVVIKGGFKYILSNNHVLARINSGSAGEPIVQPGRYDSKPICAHKPNHVASLTSFVTIKFDGSNNTVDAAIAQYDDTVTVSCATLSSYYGFPGSTPVAPFVGQAIQKVGRTTSLTTGTVAAINATVNVDYGGGRIAKFVGQIVTTNKFSRSGDSGSLVITNDANKNPVGLLFAGFSDGSSILNVMTDVLGALGNPTICSQ